MNFNVSMETPEEPPKTRPSSDTRPFAKYRDQLSASHTNSSATDHETLNNDGCESTTTSSAIPPPPLQKTSSEVPLHTRIPSSGSWDTTASDSLSGAEALRPRKKPEAKPALSANLKRLQELCDIRDAGGDVAAEIVHVLQSLKDSHTPTHSNSDDVLKEIGTIIKKGRDAVVHLQQGLVLVKNAQEQLRSALQNNNFSLLDPEE